MNLPLFLSVPVIPLLTDILSSELCLGMTTNLSVTLPWVSENAGVCELWEATRRCFWKKNGISSYTLTDPLEMKGELEVGGEPGVSP